jgi:hypothetical protein
MKIQEINNNLEIICNLFKLGTLKGFKTEKNNPCKGFDTAFFTVENDNNIYKYHFKDVATS